MAGKQYAELRDGVWLRQRYEGEKKTTYEIAAMIGATVSSVARALHRSGIHVRGKVEGDAVFAEKACELCATVFPVGGRGQRKRTARYCSRRCHMLNQTPRWTGSDAPRPKKGKDTIHNKEWLYNAYVVQQLSTTDIGELVGISREAVKWHLRKHGIPGRSQRDARKILFDRRGRKDVAQAELIEAYGSKCACCGETEPAFLSLDHIGGGGSEHRRSFKGNHVRKIRQELKAQGWPKDKYQLLCMNCNFATRHGRTCPHQLAKGPPP